MLATVTAHILLLECVGLLSPSRFAFGNVREMRRVKNQRKSFSRCTLQMRDASSANWFKVGDRVRVVEDVEKAGVNLKGKVGCVVETWEKCDVDPTCCCAEFVDTGFAVHVKFEATNIPGGRDSFIHFFAEDELLKVKEEKVVSDEDTEKEFGESGVTSAFDGMSCKAFKLDQLESSGQKPRSIFGYDPSVINDAD